MTIMNDVTELRLNLQRRIEEVSEDTPQYYDLALATAACRLAIDNPNSTSIEIAIALKLGSLVLNHNPATAM